ncbi:MAG: iron ABC transporter permease [Endomicrobia bacterium]|nr:iron ABC transporter permease [Endomicrobiia bacterium]
MIIDFTRRSTLKMETLNIEIYNNFSNYFRKRNLRLFLLLGIAMLDVLLFIYYLSFGDFKINFFEIFKNSFNEFEKHVFYEIRLKNALANLVVGGGLGFCGALMQILLKNPMASPYTLGISQGAAFGASFAIIFLDFGKISSYGEGVFLENYAIVFFAFLGSLLFNFLIFIVSFLKRFSKYSLILAGISIGAFFQSLTMFIQYFADELKLAATIFWSFGDISKSNWFMIYFSLIMLVFGLSYFIINGWKMNMFSFSIDFLKNSGINYNFFLIKGFLFVSLYIAVISSFVGIIAFVGLIAPHLARFFSGFDTRFFFPASFFCGWGILTISDIISKTLFYPAVLPVGILTSFFGVLILIYLLFKEHDKN